MLNLVPYSNIYLGKDNVCKYNLPTSESDSLGKKGRQDNLLGKHPGYEPHLIIMYCKITKVFPTRN